MTLSDYLKDQGRGSASWLAREIGAHTPDVSDWSSGKRPVPPHHSVAIERATSGAVTRQELRPNDWQSIWPELARKARKAA